MSSAEEGGGAVGAVSTDQTTNNNSNNNNPLETIIQIPGADFTRSTSELRNLQSLDEAFDGDHLDPKGKRLIQRVPSTLRRHEEFRKYFKPKVISIGPLHHDDATLEESEKLKLKLAAHFIKKIGVDMDTLYNNMKAEMDDLKKCYDPKELETNWLGCSSLTAAQFYKQFIRVAVLMIIFISGDGEKFMNAIIRFIDDTVINPAEMKEPQSHRQDRDAGIVYNGLRSDEEVAKLFNKMNTDLVPSPMIYGGVKRKIHNHCKKMWINHAAQAYHTYFRSPWTFLAFVGAITALLLGTLQTYYAIHQPK
ncbi:hypothetical protein GOBAR_AA15963 [Gossypium barbadense]|uniref:Uncharacterized protein n=1 Tax=Gossypium barbadense TaxID=3634 RepID=A0A2P5XMV5_GOSBA|nr:hypothetical protein GOBAR_AA15963 [Gossypium barbadense]